MMRFLDLTIIAVGLIALSCNQSNDSKKTETTSVQVSDEKADLTKFIQKVYKWREDNSAIDFIPTETNSQDSFYTSLDMDIHKKRFKILTDSDLFTESFLTNYNRIAIRIDKDLKDGSVKWETGDIPPFGNDADPWCNCQDTPVDNYWETLKVINIIQQDGITAFDWTWGDGFKYKVKAKKDNGRWRIDNLQGFEFNDFINY